VKAELQKGETVVWAGRPCEQLVTWKWWFARHGLPFQRRRRRHRLCCLLRPCLPEWWVKLLLGGFLSIFFFGGPLFGWLMANAERKNTATSASSSPTSAVSSSSVPEHCR
jgi:hypothetical protein